MTRGERLQEVYDLAGARVMDADVRRVRDLFGAPVGPDGAPVADRTVLGQLFEAALSVLQAHAKAIGCGQCGVCLDTGFAVDPRTGKPLPSACPIAMTDLVEAFKTGARDAALKYELARAFASDKEYA